MPKLLFISFIDFGEMKSGSSVRPQRMYAAFRKLGYDVVLLSGLQNRKRERWKRVLDIYRRIRGALPDFCYVEPPSGPFFNLCDHFLLIYLKRKGVPTGIFYRDAYWKFSDFWPVHGPKRFFLRSMHRFDLFIIRRTCKVVFFPTESMMKLFSFPVMRTLPPAGADLVPAAHDIGRRALYVGGVSEFYGTDIMLHAFDMINGGDKCDISLTVVCRKNEMKDFFAPYKGRKWLSVLHLSGDEALAPIYAAADAALYPGRRDFYMDFCMPVKLFEYLSHGLPVVSTDCREAASFVKRSGAGVVSESNAESFAAAVKRIFDTPGLLESCRKNASETIRNGNMWTHRAEYAAKEIFGTERRREK